MKRSIISMLLVFVVLTFFVSCGGSEGSNGSGEPGSIYGVVTDKATGEQIINAGVELQPIGLKTVTGSDGQFEFNEVATGTYTLFVTKTGYSDNSSSITVESGKQATGDVQLEKAPAALRIVDDNGKDISELDFGAEISDVSRQFNIFNDGYEKLEWELSFSVDWIKSVSKEGGELKAGGTQGVIVNIDRSLLESGENVTTIHVTSNDGNKQLKVKATNFIPDCSYESITPCKFGRYLFSQRANRSMNWDAAMEYCDNLVEGKYSDWYLPHPDTLLSIMYAGANIFGESRVYYWSSRENCNDAIQDLTAFAVCYGIDYCKGCMDKSENNEVRCVRTAE